MSGVGILLQISMPVLGASATNCVTTTSTNLTRPTPRSSPVRTHLPCAPCLMSLAAHLWRVNLEVGWLNGSTRICSYIFYLTALTIVVYVLVTCSILILHSREV